MKFWEILILFFIFFAMTFFILSVGDVFGDSLLDEAYYQLEESNKLIESLYRENVSLKNQIKELKKKIEVLESKNKENNILLDQCYQQLSKSNELIKELEEKNKAANYLYSQCKKDLALSRKRWQIGGGVSYPLGGEIYGGIAFKKFGFYSTAGVLNTSPYVKVGIFIRR